MTKSLVRCRACRLTWFPNGGTGAACPACGGARIGGTFELFHLGIALIALGLAGWAAPLILGDRPLPSLPAFIQAKELTAEVEKGPSQGQAVTLRRGDEVTIVKQERHRVLVKDRRGNQVYVSSKKVKKRQKAKKRSQHVQR